MEINTTLFSYSDFMQFISNNVKTSNDLNEIQKNDNLMTLYYYRYQQHNKEEFKNKYSIKFIYKIDNGD